MRILAGDIGGTKTILSLCNCSDSAIKGIFEQKFHSQEFESFHDILQKFFAACPTTSQLADRCCLAVAGPVVNGKVRITNLPWIISEQEIKEKFGPAQVVLINDFAAIGHGLTRLSDNDLLTIQAGIAQHDGVKTILGAGTGLGMCTVVTCQERQLVLPSEAGRSTFSPRDLFETKLVQHLLQSKQHVVCEDILSGGGLHNIYNYLSESEHISENPDVTDAFKHNDPAEVISTKGLHDTDELSSMALDKFVKIYAEQASQFALITMASGGVYIAGGIAPKIIPKLKTKLFIDAFLANKKMRHVLENIPLHIILNEKAGLLGAQQFASQLV